MRKKLVTNLRFGWTTGTCATAAVNAAFTALVTGAFPSRVSVITPSGKAADLAVEVTQTGHGWAKAGIIKDAGDDPDVTHGALICATIRHGAAGSGVRFLRGDGVGIITKPGLPIGVGEPAINPVPRQMMTEMITTLAAAFTVAADVEIEVSVPDGANIALKTWNPRLGITGGISILGTTGVVRPFSCSAWIASIHRGIDVARANSLAHVIGSTGATSEATALKRYALPEYCLMDMGDFVGGMLKYMRRNPVPNLTIAGGLAKLVKMGQGAIDLHSARSQVDFAQLADLAAPLGYDAKTVTGASSVMEVVHSGDDAMHRALASAIAATALATARDVLRTAPTNVEIMVVGRDGAVLGFAGNILGAEGPA